MWQEKLVTLNLVYWYKGQTSLGAIKLDVGHLVDRGDLTQVYSFP
jgi:hypothetical protein